MIGFGVEEFVNTSEGVVSGMRLIESLIDPPIRDKMTFFPTNF